MVQRILILLLLLLASTSLVIAQEQTETPTPQLEVTEPLEAGDISMEATEPAGVTNDIPPEIAAHDDDWPLAHHDYGNTRAVFGSNINSATVDQLEVAWTFPIPGRANFGAAASAPIAIADTVYFQDLESNVFALDLDTGEVIWETRYDAAVTGPNGPGIGYGRVYVISGVSSFAALDIETGQEIWSHDTGDRPTGAFQPYAYGNYVYFTTQAGVAGGEGAETFRGYTGGTSGHIMALDPETGEIAWEFQTIEAGFWGNPELNSGGGVWFSPAIDTQTGRTFWGTGNPAPFPGTIDFPNAESRPEPNLYANSMLALGYDTGDLVWYNYVNPNDLFDLDFQNSPILATIDFEAERRDIVIGSGKLGRVIALDRHTGEIIWDTPVGIHQNDDLTEVPPGETVTVYPGILGGVETPMAYANNTVYAPVLNLPTTHDATGYGAADGTEALQAADENTPTGQGTSELVAIDATTGQVLWSHEFDSDMYGGATVVNDLVFAATYDGMIYALERATGRMVWSYQAPAGINAWPAVADDTILWPAGAGNEPVLIALRLPIDATIIEVTDEATEEAAQPEATEPPSGQEQASEATAEATEATDSGQQTGGEQAGGEFITIDEANQTVTLNVVAAYDDTNGGLNFNGYSNGEATYLVPQGWTVQVEFSNQSDLPHSAMIVPQDAVSEAEMPEPVFDGASIGDPYTGITGSESFSFTAGEEGAYALACGVPGHASQGHWIVFEVGPSDAQPAFQSGG